MLRRKLVALSLGVAAVLSSLTGCASSETDCVPASLMLSSETVDRGSAVTVSSPAADCELQFTAGGKYSIVILSNNDAGNSTTPVNTRADGNGVFTARLLVPKDFPTGSARISVRGVKLPCGADESCPGYVAQVRITEG